MGSFADRRKARGSSYTYPKTKQLGNQKEQIETKKGNANNKLSESKDRSKGKDRHFPHPKAMGYPVARGPGEQTGDTLLIKCLEYIQPETTTCLLYTSDAADEP